MSAWRTEELGLAARVETVDGLVSDRRDLQIFGALATAEEPAGEPANPSEQAQVTRPQLTAA
jgi:hypothetical protein